MGREESRALLGGGGKEETKDGAKHETSVVGMRNALPQEPAMNADVISLIRGTVPVTDEDRLGNFAMLLSENPTILMKKAANGSTLLHDIVRNQQGRALEVACVQGRTGMDGIADYMQPCQLDDNGDSPFGLSCEQFSLRNVKQLLSLMEIRKIWITGKDLIKLAHTFSDEIAPYFNEMGWCHPEGNKTLVSQSVGRFPMPPDGVIVAGSSNESPFNPLLWPGIMAGTIQDSQLGICGRITKCVKSFSHDPFFAEYSEAPVKAAVIGIKDIAGPTEELDEKNVLKALYHASADDIMGTEVMKAVLDFKWEAYAGIRFRIMATSVFIYTMLFGVVSQYWHERNEQMPLMLVFTIATGLYLLYITNQLWNIGFTDFFHGEDSAYNLVELCMIMISLAVGVLSILEVKSVEEDGTMVFLGSFAALLTWFNLLFKMRCMPGIGPFMRVLLETIKDMSVFMLLLIISIVGFAQSFFLLFEKTEKPGATCWKTKRGMKCDENTMFDSFSDALFINWHMMLGEFADQIQFIKNGTSTQYESYAIFLFYLFCILIIIMLFNLLVALMGDTYNRILEDGVEDDWRLEQAGVILQVEATMSDASLADTRLFPKWVHVLRRTDVKKEASRNALLDMLDENMGDIKQMLSDQKEKTKLVLNVLSQKLKTVQLETQQLKETQDYMAKHVSVAYDKCVRAGKIDPSKFNASKVTSVGGMQRTLDSMKGLVSMKSVVNRVMKRSQVLSALKGFGGGGFGSKKKSGLNLLKSG